MIPYLIILTWQRIIYTLTDLLCNYSSISRHCCFSSVRRWFPDRRTNEQNKKNRNYQAKANIEVEFCKCSTQPYQFCAAITFLCNTAREKKQPKTAGCRSVVLMFIMNSLWQNISIVFVHICTFVVFFTVKLLWNTFGWLKRNYSW